ncbi:alginate O-acetyltransferase [Bacteroidota bacterium]|nr:alginate O-acetyltransferase [Bacteroidota bacterium]
MAFIPVYILILAVTIIIDYTAAIYIERATGRWRKQLLIISIISTCFVLFVFKYFNFFNYNFSVIASLLHLNYPIAMVNIILPIGLSFHTFQSLSYVIEVYKGNQKVEKDFNTYSLYVMFFPQLVAGPIERAGNLLPQFNKPRYFNYSLASSGAKMVLLGYFKKVVIADNAAPLVNAVYNSPADYMGFPMVVAALLFTFQIYCDFSGYSDIAIGTARILGFNLMINFNLPFTSKSITEFWRRWHISLSSWFNDYLFQPLMIATRNWAYAGAAFSLFITFFLAGLWHGAGWTFIIYGSLHGIALIYEYYTKKIRKRISKKIPGIFYNTFSMVSTFLFVSFTLIFFRSRNVSTAFFFIKNMFSDFHDYASYSKMYLKFRGMGLHVSDLMEPLIFILILLGIEFFNKKAILTAVFSKRPILKWSFYYLLIILIVFWGYENDAQNFIYFQF